MVDQAAEKERILDIIRRWTSLYGFGPSFRDIQEKMDISLGSVHNYCRDLRDEGRLTFTDNVARTMRAVDGV